MCILPKAKQHFQVHFIPKKEFNETVLAEAQLNQPKCENRESLQLEIVAKTLPTTYWLDIPKSDYLRQNRLLLSQCDSYLDKYSKVRVIEFAVVGLKNSVKQSFLFHNSSTDELKYKIVNLDTCPQFSAFKCLSANGIVAKGKADKIEFVFKPYEFGVFEGYFELAVENSENCLVLLVGVSRESSISFEKLFLTLPTTVCNRITSNSLILRNNDSIPLDFSFKKETLLQGNEYLNVTPICGKLEPNSEQKIM